MTRILWIVSNSTLSKMIIYVYTIHTYIHTHTHTHTHIYIYIYIYHKHSQWLLVTVSCLCEHQTKLSHRYWPVILNRYCKVSICFSLSLSLFSLSLSLSVYIYIYTHTHAQTHLYTASMYQIYIRTTLVVTFTQLTYIFSVPTQVLKKWFPKVDFQSR